jgi:hypothetical protein
MSVKNSLFCTPEMAQALKNEPWLEFLFEIKGMPLAVYDDWMETNEMVPNFVLKTNGGEFGYDSFEEAKENLDELIERAKKFIREGKAPKPTKKARYFYLYCKE